MQGFPSILGRTDVGGVFVNLGLLTGRGQYGELHCMDFHAFWGERKGAEFFAVSGLVTLRGVNMGSYRARISKTFLGGRGGAAYQEAREGKAVCLCLSM